MARLPIPNGDDGDWGNILNEYLEVEHTANGTLKIRTDGSVAPLAAGKVPTTYLGSGAASTNNFLRGDGSWATPVSGGGASNATASTPGLIQLAGDIGGTATAPTVPGLTSKADSSSLSTVASSGSYTDLTNRPAIPTVTGTNTGDQTLSLASNSLTISGSNGNSVTIPPASDATTSAKGIVQLAGDLSGTATTPLVAAGTIDNTKVSSLAAIAESKLNLASDAAAATASRRTLGYGANQAAQGSVVDARLTSLENSTGMRIVSYSTTTSSYPARPTGVPAGSVEYIGPAQPSDWLTNDLWLKG